MYGFLSIVSILAATYCISCSFFQETKSMSLLLYVLQCKDVTNNFNITGEK